MAKYDKRAMKTTSDAVRAVGGAEKCRVRVVPPIPPGGRNIYHISGPEKTQDAFVCRLFSRALANQPLNTRTAREGASPPERLLFVPCPASVESKSLYHRNLFFVLRFTL